MKTATGITRTAIALWAVDTVRIRERITGLCCRTAITQGPPLTVSVGLLPANCKFAPYLRAYISWYQLPQGIGRRLPLEAVSPTRYH